MPGVEWWQTTFSDLDYWKWEGIPSEKYTLGDVGFIEKTLALPAGSRLLDLGCGFGRHSIELTRRGYRMTALDWSEPFLVVAREKASEAGVEVDFARGDMRAMEFRDEFDGAFLWENTFGIFDDAGNLAVLRCVAQALKPGGRFLVANNAPRGFGQPEKTWEGDPERDEWLFLYESLPFDVRQHRNGFLVTLWNLRTGERKTHSFSTREYAFPDMVRMLDEAGLRFVEVYGDHVDWTHYRQHGGPRPDAPEGFTWKAAQRVILAEKR
jgi:SAM-dependent methyltransferase